MQKNQFIKTLIYFTLLISAVSCDSISENEDKNFTSINKYLKIALPSDVTSFNSANRCLDASFKSPCIFFSSFSLSKDNFSDWIKEVKVQLVDSSFLKNNCNNDQQVLNKLINLNLHDFAEARKHTWWNPLLCNHQILYASFYNSQSKNLVYSFKDSWDGRVLILFCEEKSICHLIVETFL